MTIALFRPREDAGTNSNDSTILGPVKCNATHSAIGTNAEPSMSQHDDRRALVLQRIIQLVGAQSGIPKVLSAFWDPRRIDENFMYRR
jgi:hypothetical protein